MSEPKWLPHCIPGLVALVVNVFFNKRDPEHVVNCILLRCICIEPKGKTVPDLGEVSGEDALGLLSILYKGKRTDNIYRKQYRLDKAAVTLQQFYSLYGIVTITFSIQPLSCTQAGGRRVRPRCADWLTSTRQLVFRTLLLYSPENLVLC